ncbi:MAG TPA: Na+/H+ antiporter [Gemmatimonadaceae bacterium]
MQTFEIILVLLFVASLAQPVARRFDVPVAIGQVLCGLGLSAVPALRQIEIPPEFAFTIFVPPLLFWAATTGSLRDIRRYARPILLLATGLVLFTTAVVAAVAHAVAPSLSWPAVFVLGVMVAPSDAEITVSIARRLGVPPRVVTILEGETLLNDTTAFVTYRLAIRVAVMGGLFSFPQAVLHFATLAIIGVAVGFALGWVLAITMRLHAEAITETTFSLLTPFASYLIAERVGGSGVLAVVTSGLMLSRFAPRSLSARTRVQARSTWEAVTFLIGGVIFTLLGLQLGRLAPTLLRIHDVPVFRLVAIVSVTVIAVRAIWVFLGAYIPRLNSSYRARSPIPPWQRLTITSWAGLRGGDTLIMVLAVPYTTATGAPFPSRDAIIAVAFGVVVVTIIVQGLSLRPLIKVLALAHDDMVEDEERRARLEAERAGLAHLEVVAKRDKVPNAIVWYVQALIRRQTRLDIDAIEHGQGHEDGTTPEDLVRRLERGVLEAERAAVVRLRDDNVIGQEAMRRVLLDLDLDEVRRA